MESDDDDESPSPSDKTTLWVVSVQGGNDSDDKEERILSRNFGRILVAGQDENTNVNKKRNPKKKSRRHVTPTKDAVSDATAVSVSEDDKAKSTTKAKAAAATTKAKATAKGVKKGGNNNNTIKDDNNNNSNDNNDNDNQGARTTRTTRRQRGDDSGLFVGNIEDIPKAKKPLKRPREPEAVNNPDETVIKVKMLTGTVSIMWSIEAFYSMIG